MRRRIGAFTLGLLGIVATMSCGNQPTVLAPVTGTAATVASIAVTLATPFTGVGQKIQLTASATMSTGATQDVTAVATWQSSNTAVLSVSTSGLATSVAEGDAKITASYQSIAGSSDVSVRIQWSVKGRLIATADAAPIATGAAIAIDGAQSATVGSDGSYSIQGLGAPTSKALTITAPGFVTRNTAIAINGARTGVDLDLISLASPFSLAFYREFLRGSADNNGLLQRSFRWDVSPSFYINRRDGSSEIPASVIAELAAYLPALVAQVSDGKLSVQRIETGTETRPTVAGWINVEYTTSINSCGLAAIGGNLARIHPICSDLTFVGLHEVTHALGFWHHTQVGGLMSRVQPTAHARGLSAIEAFHTKIAFSRPRGNVDPDTDPQTAAPLGVPNTAVDRTLACWPIR